MKTTSDRIKEKIMEAGVDLVGIASAEELILAYPPRPAVALMPSAKSVIVMAVAHSLGAVYSPDIMLWTRNKMQTSRLLDETTDVDNCIECMRVCPVGETWKNIRPKKIPLQKTGGTE